MVEVRILGIRAAQTLPCLLSDIREKREAGYRTVVLVPEQYTLQAERELVEGLELPGLIDLDVMSPTRLDRLIRERAGSGALPALDDRGRAMALAQALMDVEEELHYYRRVARQPSLPDRLSVLLTDMEKAMLHPDLLLEWAEKQRPGAAREKLRDIGLIWKDYLAVIEGRFADPASHLEDQLRRLEITGLLERTAIFVAGFDIIQPDVARTLTAAAKQAESITVALTIDSRNERPIFYAQKRTASRLMDALTDAGVPCRMEYRYPKPLQNAALRHLEKQLFAVRNVPYDHPTEAIALHIAPNPCEEAAYAASQLRAWHEAGIPWERMAVAYAQPGEMEGLLDQTLSAMGIPHFLSRKDAALRHGLCRFLIGAVRSVCGGWEQEDVLLALKSGFSPVRGDEIAQLENYALSNGISRAKWRTPFTRGEDAEAMEPLRVRLTAPMMALQEDLRKARSATASMEAIYDFLNACDAYQRLLENEDALLRRGMLTEAAQNRQIWQLLMGLLDQMHALLGDHRVAMKELPRLLEGGLNGARIATLPPTDGTVAVGEAGHLMTGRIDALILVGMQDGVTASPADSLITERERAQFTSDESTLPIGLTREERASLRQMDFYRAMTLPTEHLLLTASGGGTAGEALRESTLLTSLRALFPQMRVTGGVATSELVPLSPQTALETLAVMLRDCADGKSGAPSGEWLEALRRLWFDPAWHDQAEMILSGLQARVEAKAISKGQAAVLYQQDAVSITRLETFAQCPYRYFVQHGLRPSERRDFTFRADEKGTFFHAVLEAFIRSAAADPEWPNLTGETIDRLVNEAINPAKENWENGPLDEDSASRSLADEYIRTIRRAAHRLADQMRHGQFVTVGAEVRFGEGGDLPPVTLVLRDGTRIALQGMIDRMDAFRDGDRVWLSVIDYKSGTQRLDPVRIRHGLQLQLLLYLQAASEGFPQGEAAGAFYFIVTDPLVETDSEDAEEIDRDVGAQMRLSGVVVADKEIVKAIDGTEKGGQVLDRAIFKNDGTIARNALAADSEGLRQLMRHANETAAALADRIRDGEIDIAPAKIGDWKACDYCPAALVCGRDARLPGGTPRELERGDKSDVWQELVGTTFENKEKG